MPQLRPYRLFISHAWTYGDEYNRLINLLNNAPLFDYYNYSAPKENPLVDVGCLASEAYLQSRITQKIRPAQVTLVLSGMYTAHSEWMQYEIRESQRMEKPIIGIVPWSQSRIPAAVRQSADKIVSWNTSSIVSAIRELV